MVHGVDLLLSMICDSEFAPMTQSYKLEPREAGLLFNVLWI
jgi:hypothetical protein